MSIEAQIVIVLTAVLVAIAAIQLIPRQTGNRIVIRRGVSMSQPYTVFYFPNGVSIVLLGTPVPELKRLHQRRGATKLPTMGRKNEAKEPC